MIHRLDRRERPGGYASRRHKELRKAWQRRMFPRWTTALILLVALLAVVGTLLPNPWKTMLLVFACALPVGWWGLREALLPDHIARWQRGEWGERMTAKELKPLIREGWCARHDLDADYGNYDHVLIGNAVFLLDSKYLMYSELSLEGEALRVTHIDQPLSNYLMDGLTRSMEKKARRLWKTIKAETGKSRYVHPVVVLWGSFPEGVQNVRGVTYIGGNQLARWLREQPAELDSEARVTYQSWLRRHRRR